MSSTPSVPQAAMCVLCAYMASAGAWRSAGADEPPRPVELLHEAIPITRTMEPTAQRDESLRDIVQGLAILGAIPDALAAGDTIAGEAARGQAINHIISKQIASGDLAGALRTVDSLNTPILKQYGQEVYALQRIAAAQAKVGDIEGAMATAQRLDRRAGFYGAAMSSVIQARAESGDVDGAIRQAEELDESTQNGPPAEQSLRQVALASIVRVLAERNDLDHAQRLFDVHPSLKARGLAAFARARYRAKDLDGAMSAARALLEAGGDGMSEATARAVLVRALIDRGDLDTAIQAVNVPWKAAEVTRSNRFMPPSIESLRGRTCFAIARAQAERGDLDKARITLAASGSELHGSLRLLDLARARLDKDDLPGARSLVAAAREAMEAPSGSEFYLENVAAMMVRCGDVEAARPLFARALFARDIGSARNRPNIVASQFVAGDRAGAMKTLEAIPEAEVRDDARLWLAVHNALDGRADEALDVAAAIARPTLRATASAQVGMILAERGDRDRGAATCRRATEIDPDPTPEVTRILAHAWAAVPGETDAALAWARSRPALDQRVAGLFGAAWGLSGRPFWFVHDSRLVVLTHLVGPAPSRDDDLDP